MFWFTTKENVMRVLSDLKPAPTFWCRIGLHTWKEWEIVRRGTANGGASGKRFAELDRCCDRCNYIQLKCVFEKYKT